MLNYIYQVLSKIIYSRNYECCRIHFCLFCKLRWVLLGWLNCINSSSNVLVCCIYWINHSKIFCIFAAFINVI